MPLRITVMASIVWVLAVAAVSMLAARANLLPEAPDKWTYDWRTYLLSETADRQRDDIAVILIDERSLALYPAEAPIDRRLTAALVRAIDAAGPRAIGLDLIFDRETDKALTDQLLAAIHNAKAPVILGAVDRRVAKISEEQLAYQEAFLSEARRPAGHLIVLHQPRWLTVSDQVVRFVAPQPDTEPSRLSFAEVIASLDKERRMPKSRLISWQHPPAKGGSTLVPVIHVAKHEPGSPDDVILPPTWRVTLKDRVVLVGGDFVDRDQHVTPFAVADSQKTPGVLILAQTIGQLFDERAIYLTPRSVEGLCVLALTALGFWIARLWRVTSHDFWVSIVGIVALVIIGGVVFWAIRTIIPSSGLFLAWLAGVWGGHYCPWALRLFGVRAASPA